ncbi:hypothetical protein V3C99_009696 [Haemonchus contortus]
MAGKDAKGLHMRVYCIQMILQSLVLLSLCLTAYPLPSLQAYIAKYRPEIVTEGTRTYHVYPKNRIEVTLSFGTNDKIIRVAETAINDYFSGDLYSQGDETERMGEVMEHYFGGLWSVAIFDDPYGFYWTIIRRSPAFVTFDVNGKGITFAKEGIKS